MFYCVVLVVKGLYCAYARLCDVDCSLLACARIARPPHASWLGFPIRRAFVKHCVRGFAGQSEPAESPECRKRSRTDLLSLLGAKVRKTSAQDVGGRGWYSRHL